MDYNEKLRQSAKETESIACMGLDPVLEQVPGTYSEFKPRVEGFFEVLFNEMKEQGVFPGAFKPNHGFYSRHDEPQRGIFQGSQALGTVLKMLEERFSGIPVILDFKRGDIAKSSANYAREGFVGWGADAVTVAPYMGTDSVGPFAEYCNDEQGKGVYVLNRTSNKIGAADFQSKMVLGVNNQQLHLVVADKIVEWAEGSPGVGAVVGATSLEEMAEITKVYAGKNIPLLIPGVGGQGGKADEVVDVLTTGDYDLSLARINSSSGVTHPWAKNEELKAKLEGKDVKEHVKYCVASLNQLNEDIRYKAA
jgi:orotidine-5'-phosphate decarboxylase